MPTVQARIQTGKQVHAFLALGCGEVREWGGLWRKSQLLPGLAVQTVSPLGWREEFPMRPDPAHGEVAGAPPGSQLCLETCRRLLSLSTRSTQDLEGPRPVEAANSPRLR